MNGRRWIGWGFVMMGASALLRGIARGRKGGRHPTRGSRIDPYRPVSRVTPEIPSTAQIAYGVPEHDDASEVRIDGRADGATVGGSARGGESSVRSGAGSVGAGRLSPVALLRRTFAEWREDKVPLLASSLAYYTVFSLAPLLIIVIALLSLFGQTDAESTIVQQFGQTVGEQGAELVQGLIENRSAEGGNVIATLIAVLILLFGATGVFVQLQNALNTIWEVQPDPDKSGVGRLLKVRALSLGMILAIGFLLLVSLLMSTLIESLASGANGVLPGADALWLVLNWVLSLAVITLLFALIFKFLPDAVIPWRTVWIGALATALLFTLGKWGLSVYLSRAAVASAYGAAGSLVVLLLWVFYSAQIVLFGGEFTQVYARSRGERIQPDENAVPAES